MTLGWYNASLGIVAVAGMLASSPVHAQIPTLQLAHESADVQRVQRVQKGAVLQQRIDLDVTNVTLASLLDAIGDKANTKISYVDRVVASAPRITIRKNAITVEEALQRALGPTALTYMVYEGRVAVVAKTPQRAEQGVITGKVTHSETKKPLIGAVITVGGMKDVITGEDGTFRLQLPAGTHTITIRHLGMVRQTRQVTISDDGTQHIEVALEPSASVLNEVIVTGTVSAAERREIPNPITVITADEIEKRGITRVEQLLRGEVPGVIALERGSAGYGSGTTLSVGLSTDGVNGMQRSEVYARGSSTLRSGDGANPLKTYVDGVELLDPAYLGTIDPQTIDRIEIIVGPQAAAVYGSGAMAGVMQIFTKKGSAASTFDVSLDAKYGTIESNINDGRTPIHNDRLSVNSGVGPLLTYSATASHQYSGHWIPGLWSRTVGGSLGLNHIRGPLTIGSAISMNWGRNGTANPINGGTPYWIEKTRSGEWRLPSEYSQYQSSMIAASTSQNVSLNVNYQPSPDWQHHLTLGRNQTNFSSKSEIPDTLYRRVVSGGQRASANYNTTWQGLRLPGVSTTVTAGANATSASEVASSGCSLVASAATLVNCRESSQQMVAVRQMVDDKNWGGFGSVRFGLFDRLYLTLGLRAEVNPTYGREHKVDWTPTNGIAYTMEYGDVSVKLLGSYGRSTRAPNSEWRLGETSVSTLWTPAVFQTRLESPNLRPEYARGPQGGIEVYYGNLGSFSVNRYVQTVSDLIMRLAVDSVEALYFNGQMRWRKQYQYVNAAGIRQHGWETTGSLNLGPVQLKGSYSWMDSRIESLLALQELLPPSELYVGKAFSNLPTHTGNITISYATGPTSATLVTNYVGSSNKDAYLSSYDYTQLRVLTYTGRANGFSGEEVNQGYTKSNLAVSQRLNPSWNLLLNVTNLGNNFGTDHSHLWPAMGRQTTLGIQYRFRK